MSSNWGNLRELHARTYRCGHCYVKVGSNLGYQTALATRQSLPEDCIYICPNCGKPTIFKSGKQIPDVPPGREVQHLPETVGALYTEARNCVATSAYTASILVCRKLLMNIAVSQGAAPGLRFIEYVNFLAEKGFVPPNGLGWVDHIRRKGNEATHEIVLVARDDAVELISFLEMLLTFIFEFPAKIPVQNDE